MQRLLKMARCVCSGMEYLSTVGYVHRVSHMHPVISVGVPD